ncbi:hypothetical protein SEA_IDAHO_22 [Arthrobacter phage Idaho]|uniref:Uncharacterized protein n=1 Tax=Arthrobacter phage Idaho TaxID=2565509 RepID=A0A4D6T983_9CAUD|nr:hypothetical protein QEX67_gp22 [Arthrobacter phage Idaho]QCG78285.1 hypothetical protein SEA_IDAHO_22 [Arthrobacter phage Idaho]
MVLKQEALDNLVVLESGTELTATKAGLVLSTKLPKGAGRREIGAHLRAVASSIEGGPEL